MSTQDRLHALDAVRAFALLAGIVLHASMSFILPIPAMDVSQSAALGVSTYVIHTFRMSLFYLLAGFFAHMVLHRKGARAFVADRTKRIVAPMLVGWVVLAPITIAVTIWGLVRTFGLEALQAADQSGGSRGLPLVHLWFLYYLVIFYAIAVAVRGLLETALDRTGRLRRGVDVLVRGVLGTYLAPVLVAVPLAVHLYFNEAWVWSGGIPTPDTGLMPQAPAMIGFGTAFALGWLLHRQMDLLRRWEKQWPAYLIGAVALTGVCLWVLGQMPETAMTLVPGPELLTVPGPQWMRAAYTAAFTASIWCWTFGLTGAALKFCSAPSPVRRYIADSSYWLYLAHLPLVFFLQVVLAKVPWHWTVKFPLILVITFAVLFASYHYLVRPTFIGKVLNGRKYPRAPAASEPAVPVGVGGAAG